MAGAFTRLHIIIEGIEFTDQGGFVDVMNNFERFLWHQFHVRLISDRFPGDPPPRPQASWGPGNRRPTSQSWRKTLGLDPHAAVGVREIEHAFRVLAKKLRPDRITHDAATENMRRRAARWNRVMEAREAALREVQ